LQNQKNKLGVIISLGSGLAKSEISLGSKKLGVKKSLGSGLEKAWGHEKAWGQVLQNHVFFLFVMM
jgi:hypothetical protein